MKRWEDWNECWIVGRYNSNLLFVKSEQKSFCLKCGQMVPVHAAKFKITNTGLLEKAHCFNCFTKIRSYREYHYINRYAVGLLQKGVSILEWGRRNDIQRWTVSMKNFYHIWDHTPKYRELKRVMVLQPYEEEMMDNPERIEELLMKCDNETSLNYWRNNMTNRWGTHKMPQMNRKKRTPTTFLGTTGHFGSNWSPS